MAFARTMLVTILVCIPIGGVGAWAFNPDTGAVAHSELLWRVFGIMFEGALFFALPIGLCFAVVALIRRQLQAHSAHRR